jgi:hypothetical protein
MSPTEWLILTITTSVVVIALGVWFYPANPLKLLDFLTGWHLATPATPRAPPGARASTSSDRSTAASAASFNSVPLKTAKVVLTATFDIFCDLVGVDELGPEMYSLLENLVGSNSPAVI